MSAIIRRTELTEACLELGDTVLDLSGYATTGLRIVAVGPSGSGKTNAGLLIAEQLSQQGWVSVLVDSLQSALNAYLQRVYGCLHYIHETHTRPLCEEPQRP